MKNITMKKIIALVKKILKISSDHDLAVYAGYSTLYILTAAIPLLMVIVAAVYLMPGFSVDDFQAFLFQFIPEVPEIQNLLANIIRNLSSQTSSFVASVSAVTSIWSASAGISAIQKGLDKLYGTSSKGLMAKVKALLYTVLFTFQILAMLVFQVLGSSIKGILRSLASSFVILKGIEKFASVINASSIIVGLITVVVILLTYTYLPGGKRILKKQVPGAVFTAVIWVIFSIVFSVFIPRFWKASSLYGSLASIFLMTMWLRIMITILFYGACLNEGLKSE